MIDWLQAHLGMNPELRTRLLVTVGTIVGLWLLRHFVLGFVYGRVQDAWGRYRWRRGVGYALVTVAVVCVARASFVWSAAVMTYLWCVTVALAMRRSGSV